MTTLIYKLADRLDRIFNTQTRVAKSIRRIGWLLDDLQEYGIKFMLLQAIWNVLRRLDAGESSDYETAPYCGHHYSGFENKYIKESYHEGDGGGHTKVSLFGYYISYENIDGEKYFLNRVV